MANTYTQLNVHGVFAVKGRNNFILAKHRDEIFGYISGILKNIGQFPLAVNGYTDHVHIFLELDPSTSLSDVMEKVKANSSKWINEKGFVTGKFEWQRGYGAFTHSHSSIDRVVKYILNQEIHHRKKSFKEEYMEMLVKNEIKFNDAYLFDFHDDIDS